MSVSVQPDHKIEILFQMKYFEDGIDRIIRGEKYLIL